MRMLLSGLLLLFSSLFTLYAQKITLTGTVYDSRQQPISGATITLKGTSFSISTNLEGKFSIPDFPSGTIILISHIGFATREMTIQTSPVRIVLTANSADLDEVVVQGYGTTTRRLNTGSIGKVSAADLEKQPVSNPLAALQGRVPGVVITQTSGVPGSEIKVQIRGRSSLDQNLSRNDPLYVIDNVPFEPGNLNTNQLTSAASNPTSISQGGLSPLNSINPQDIESIEVLKDADATAIYGSRGANGVILITTKKGRPGKTRLAIRSSLGASRITRTMDMLNTQQYLAMRREAYRNDGTTPSRLNAPDLYSWDTTRYTDLTKLLIGNTALTSSFQGTLSGGTSATQFSVSGSLFRQSNVFSSQLADQIRSARFTLNHSTPDKKLTLLFTGIYSSDKNQLVSTDLTRYINLPPHIKLYDSLGNINWKDTDYDFSTLNLTNPLSILKTRYVSTNENLSANLNLSYALTAGLKIRLSTGYNTFSSTELSQRPTSAINPAYNLLPSADFAGGNSKSYILEPQAEWTPKLGSGNLAILAGATWQDRSNTQYSMSGTNYTSDLLLGSVAAAGKIAASNTAQQYRYTAFFGRINYSFARNTYILNLSGRRDASSRFGPDKRTALFGAAGGAWIFSNYGWIRQHLPFVSFGKLRGSYGITGNDQIGNYKFLNLWNTTSVPYSGVPSLQPASLYNGDYSWEINKKGEGAIELGFLQERLQFSAAYYRNRFGNQLTTYNLPSQTGFDNVVRNLPALVQNSGWELLLSGKILRRKNLEWSSALNLTFPKNKLISFPGLATSSYSLVFVEGQPLSLVRGYDYLGVDPKTGIYQFRDVNGDGQYTTADWVNLGSLDPKYYGGWQHTLTYKGFQFSLFFEFRRQKGRSYLDQLSATPPGILNYNQPVIVLDRWQGEGDLKPIQKYSAAASSAAGIAVRTRLNSSSGLYTDASYIRCKNLSVAYSLPGIWIKRLHFESVRIHLQAQNLFVLTRYQGADPETQNFYILPPLRTVVAGLDITL